MIYKLNQADRARARARRLARRQWRTWFVPLAWLDVEGFGRVWVVAQLLETRWSETHRRRLWRVPL